MTWVCPKTLQTMDVLMKKIKMEHGFWWANNFFLRQTQVKMTLKPQKRENMNFKEMAWF